MDWVFVGLHINLVVACSGTRLTVNLCLNRATIIRLEDVGGVHCMEFRGVNIVFSIRGDGWYGEGKEGEWKASC